MTAHKPPAAGWTPAEQRVLDTLSTPAAVQVFLDQTPYSTQPIYRCPRRVLADRKAHCFDGATLAVAALKAAGWKAALLDLRAVRDDDHVLAVYQQDKRWGCVAKSNFVGLRSRQPVHKTLRELVMTYFEPYYNMDGERVLRSFSTPQDPDVLGLGNWRLEDRWMKNIAAHLDRAPHEKLLSTSAIRRLPLVDERTYRANMLGTDLKGVYWPGGKKRDVKPPRA